MPDGPPAAWIVTGLGLSVLVSPFGLACSRTSQILSLVSGIIVPILGAGRGMQPEEKGPMPGLLVAVIIVGRITIASPLLFGKGVSETLGDQLDRLRRGVRHVRCRDGQRGARHAA